MNAVDMNSRTVSPIHIAPLPTAEKSTQVKTQPVDVIDTKSQSRRLWDAAGIGAAAAGITSAVAYHLPRFSSFASLSVGPQWGVLAGLGLTVGAATHAFVSQVRGGKFQSAAWPATIAVGAAFLGLGAVGAPAFVGLSALGQVVVWGAVAAAAGTVNALSRQDAGLTFKAATGAVGGAVAASALIAPLTPMVMVASAALGSGLGAVHHKISGEIARPEVVAI